MSISCHEVENVDRIFFQFGDYFWQCLGFDTGTIRVQSILISQLHHPGGSSQNNYENEITKIQLRIRVWQIYITIPWYLKILQYIEYDFTLRNISNPLNLNLKNLVRSTKYNKLEMMQKIIVLVFFTVVYFDQRTGVSYAVCLSKSFFGVKTSFLSFSITNGKNEKNVQK